MKNIESKKVLENLTNELIKIRRKLISLDWSRFERKKETILTCICIY